MEVAERETIAEDNFCPIDVFDVDKIREDFPILRKRVHGKRLVYLDNAATSQKPQSVIDTISAYYSGENANIHRGVHYLSQLATQRYEETRTKIKDFINASSEKEIIFTSGTTESINLVAAAYGRLNIREGDEIIVSNLEHHSNIVPWQLLCEQTGGKLKVIPIDDNGDIIFEEYKKLLNEKTKLVAIVHVSNSLGTITPVKEIIVLAHEYSVPVLIDGAQAVPHSKVDVQDLDCDFYCFSGHKMFGPTGVGVLYGKESILEGMAPYQGGGDMIKTVTFEKTTYSDLPSKLEAGTPNIAGVIGLGAAIDYINKIGYNKISTHEEGLLNYAQNALLEIDELRIIGTAQHKAAVISFVIGDIHPHDVGTILDQNGIAIRTGHHCTQPVMARYNLSATSRASFAFYNTKDEIDQLVDGIYGVLKLFK